MGSLQGVEDVSFDSFHLMTDNTSIKPQKTQSVNINLVLFPTSGSDHVLPKYKDSSKYLNS